MNFRVAIISQWPFRMFERKCKLLFVEQRRG